MKIAVAGVGYVGLSLAVLLSQRHEVVAVSTTQAKVDMINAGKSPIVDQEISRYLAGKGYGFSTIRHVIGQLQDEAEDAFCPEQ